MKRSIIIITTVLLLTASALVYTLFWWNKNTKPPSTTENYQRLVVPKGRTATQVGNLLYEKELIRNPLTFKLYVQLFGKSKNINAGEFLLSPHMNVFEITEALGEGPLELWVTIPEGLRKEQMIEIFTDSLKMNKVDAEVFKKEFVVIAEDKEGYLFPDTYLFPPDVSAADVVETMTDTFDSKIDEQMSKEIKSSGYGLDDHIKMASIIEREAVTDQERPIIAGILWKRLNSDGWLLQADATVQYGVANQNCDLEDAQCTDWWPILSKKDIEIDSPYNSYKFKPLPPTPISNPGLSSIKAAILPKNTQYWYYIHDPEGNIHYAKTLSEHNLNVSRYLGK